MTDTDYMAVCERCDTCMDETTYQRLEAAAHQVEGSYADLVLCPMCNGRDWRFESLAD